MGCGEQAIHPGYGFLSENPEFSKRCKENGIKFVGPSYETMRLLSSKKCFILCNFIIETLKN